MKNSSVMKMTFCGIAIAVNIVLGIMTSMLSLPIYLDTLGTVISAILLGPLPGVAVGALTNIITGFIYNPRDIPFLLVNVAVALIVGLIARKYKFTLTTAILCGVILGIICPVIGTPIGVLIYGGLSGSVSDIFVMALKSTGNSIFTSAFIVNIGKNIIDKVGTCILVFYLVKHLPVSIVNSLVGYGRQKQCTD